MIWIIGSGYMAKEYCKVLKSLNRPFKVIGRSNASATQFTKETGITVETGGIENFLITNPIIPEYAIVCTPVEVLSSVTILLIKAGVKSILLEKPGALSSEELDILIFHTKKYKAQVHIGYNRRFYQSVLAAEKMIQQDQGLIAVNFEMSEWSHQIKDAPYDNYAKKRWVLSNTSHVIDLAFFVAGHPEKFSFFTTGNLDWHPSAARFPGAGISAHGALLSYHGYWDAPGRWSVELVTTQRKFILKPMEKLQIQKIASLEIHTAENIDYHIDEQFKPGLYLQTNAFLKHDHSRLCSLINQKTSFTFFEKMAGYNRQNHSERVLERNV